MCETQYAVGSCIYETIELFLAVTTEPAHPVGVLPSTRSFIGNQCSHSAVYKRKLNASNRQNAFIPINLSQHENSSLTSPDAALASVDNASLHSNSHSINNLPHSIHRRRSSSPASLSPQNYSNNRQHHHQQHSILHNGNIFKIMFSM